MSSQISRETLLRWDDEAQRLCDLVVSTPADEIDRPIAGDWSPRQILAHMLDAELVYGGRLRAAVAQPGMRVMAFDQDAWARGLPYQDLPIEMIGSAFVSLRRLNTAMLLALDASAWDQVIDHPERGSQKLSEVVPVFGNHIADHLKELEAVASARGSA